MTYFIKDLPVHSCILIHSATSAFVSPDHTPLLKCFTIIIISLTSYTFDSMITGTWITDTSITCLLLEISCLFHGRWPISRKKVAVLKLGIALVPTSGASNKLSIAADCFITYSIVAVVNHLVHVPHTLIKMVRQLLLKHWQFLEYT